MAIVKTAERGGVTIGFDDELGKWVPIDESYQQGSAVGNIARGARDEMGRIGLGIRSMADDSPLMQSELGVSRQEQAAQSASAPVASAIGGAVPDIGAAIGAGLLTQGAGLPAMLAAEAGTGAVMGAARPGAVEERVQNAAWGAGLNLAGLGIGSVAERGIVKGLEISRGLLAGSTRRTMQAVDSIKMQGEADRMFTDAEFQQGLKNVTKDAGLEVDEGAAPGQLPAEAVHGSINDNPLAQAQESQAQSVGAAQTPRSALDPETLAMRESAGEVTESQAKELQKAAALGYRIPAHVGTARGSSARMMKALEEYSPFGNAITQANTAANKELLSRATAKAMGLSDTLDPAANKYSKITLTDRDEFLKNQSFKYNQLQEVMPAVPANDIAAGVKTIRNESLLDDPEAEKVLRRLEEKAKEAGGKPVPSSTIMQTIRGLQDKAAKAVKNGESNSADMYYSAIDTLHGIVETNLSRLAEKTGSRDASKSAKRILSTWREMRRTSNLGRMLETGSAIGADYDINSVSLLSKMKRQPKNGGFGPGGPPESSPLRDLWDLVVADAQSGTGVPHTGVRQVIAQSAKRWVPGAGVAYSLFGN